MIFKLRTKMQIPISDVTGLPKPTPIVDSIVEMHIHKISYQDSETENTTSVWFNYFNESGQTLPVKKGKNPFTVSGDGLVSLSQSINSLITMNSNIKERMRNEVLIVAKIQFAADWDLESTDIELF